MQVSPSPQGTYQQEKVIGMLDLWVILMYFVFSGMNYSLNPEASQHDTNKSDVVLIIVLISLTRQVC
ncbi:Hypothetical predicted protein [Marmota monax]|uniref:Ion transport domain-containing protein n=1 Tax=Marmota monax TaxID=9995 RepID=A0A5E4CBH4_MARMO|nr:Hypothetical predicted protein [Marmota monax]